MAIAYLHMGFDMLFSSAINYALRAMATLPEDGSYCQTRDLADRLGLPGPYLSKIFRALVHDGILDSNTGPGGGFRLARPAHHVTVGEVVKTLNGRDASSGCVLGFTDCDAHDHPCELYLAWQTMAMVTVRDIHLLELRGSRSHPPGRSPGSSVPGRPAVDLEPQGPVLIQDVQSPVRLVARKGEPITQHRVRAKG
jgi:Rrf2 family protein